MANMFLKLDGIAGETLDQNHLHEIEITDWNWTVTNEANLKMKADKSSKVDVTDITVTKVCDRASINLLRYCTLGSDIPSGVITCRKNFGEKVVYLVITMTQMKISSMHWDFQEQTGMLVEVVKLNFAKFSAEYRGQDNLGYQMGTIDFIYDVSHHKEINHHEMWKDD